MDYQLEKKNVEWITSWIEGYKMDYKYRTEGMQNELLAGQKGVEWITSQIEWYRMDYKYRIEGMQNELLVGQKGVEWITSWIEWYRMDYNIGQRECRMNYQLDRRVYIRMDYYL